MRLNMMRYICFPVPCLLVAFIGHGWVPATLYLVFVILIQISDLTDLIQYVIDCLLSILYTAIWSFQVLASSSL